MKRLRKTSVRRAASFLACLALAAPLCGCVERKLVLRSDPPGAMVVVNGEEAGLAPATLQFDTYGVFEVVMSAPGHARLRTNVPVRPPWFEQIPFDFFTEVLWPFTLHDVHEVTLTLQPLSARSPADVDERERQLRDQVERLGPEMERK